MRAFTHLCNKVNISIFNDGITLYPLDTSNKNEVLNVVEAFYNYRHDSFGAKMDLGVELKGIVDQKDPGHDSYHQDNLSSDKTHYHIKFADTLDEEKLDKILAFMVKKELISKEEKDGFMVDYRRANVLDEVIAEPEITLKKRTETQQNKEKTHQPPIYDQQLINLIEDLMLQASAMGIKSDNAHQFDKLIMRHWKQIREQAIRCGIFEESETQINLFNHFNYAPVSHEETALNDAINELKRRFITEGIVDGFQGDYSEDTKKGWYTPVNPLEFWLVFNNYISYCKEQNDSFPSFDAIVVDAIDPQSRDETYYPSHAGFIANLFSTTVMYYGAYFGQLESHADNLDSKSQYEDYDYPDDDNTNQLQDGGNAIEREIHKQPSPHQVTDITGQDNPIVKNLIAYINKTANKSDNKHFFSPFGFFKTHKKDDNTATKLAAASKTLCIVRGDENTEPLTPEEMEVVQQGELRNILGEIGIALIEADINSKDINRHEF